MAFHAAAIEGVHQVWTSICYVGENLPPESDAANGEGLPKAASHV